MDMERTHEYASKGVAGAGLGTGIAGLSLGVINTVGGLALAAMNSKKSSAVDSIVPAMAGVVAASAAGSATRNTGYCNEDHNVNRYEAAQAARIAELETEVKLRDANTYTDQKMLELYQYTNGRLRNVESQLCQQAVINAQTTANISCMQQNLNELNGMTKTVIPIGNICPEPMARYNSWTAPTTESAT